MPPLLGEEVRLELWPVKTIIFPEIVIAGLTELFTVMNITLLLAVAGAAQDKLLVKITFTCVPFESIDVENVLLFVPAFTPLTCH